MKHTLLFAMLLLLPVMAMAQDDTSVIDLPGNAKVITGGNNNGNVIIQRKYGTRDYIYDRLINDDDRRLSRNTVPVNDINAICGGADKQSDRRECRRDVIKEQKKLYKKYN